MLLGHEPNRVFRHIACYLPRSDSYHTYIQGCHDIIQHKQAFRTHITFFCRVQLVPFQIILRNIVLFSPMVPLCLLTCLLKHVPSTLFLSLPYLPLRPPWPRSSARPLMNRDLGVNYLLQHPNSWPGFTNPLHTKVVLNCIPPIGFTGGRLVDLPKPGAPSHLSVWLS